MPFTSLFLFPSAVVTPPGFVNEGVFNRLQPPHPLLIVPSAFGVGKQLFFPRCCRVATRLNDEGQGGKNVNFFVCRAAQGSYFCNGREAGTERCTWRNIGNLRVRRVTRSRQVDTRRHSATQESFRRLHSAATLK